MTHWYSIDIILFASGMISTLILTPIFRRIAAAGQEQVLRFWDELDDSGRARLSAQLEAVNFEELPGLLRLTR